MSVSSRKRVQKRAPVRLSNFQSFSFSLSTIWSIHPMYIASNYVFAFRQIPSRVFNVWIIQFIVNTATTSKNFRAIAIALSLYLACQFVVYGLRSVLERDYNLSVEEGIKAQIQENLHKKAMRVDIALFDDEDFYNDYSQALSDLDEKTIESFKQSVKVLEAIISTLTLAGTIAVLSPTLILIVAVSSVASTLIFSARAKVMACRRRALVPLKRRLNCINDLFCKRQYAEDMRVERIGEVATDDFAKTTRELVATSATYNKRSASLSFLGYAVDDAFIAAVWAYLASCLVEGAIDAGTFMALSNASLLLSSCLGTLADAVPSLSEECLAIQDARKFESYTPTIDNSDDRAKMPACVSEVDFVNVSFSYKEGESALKNVSFEARRGAWLAIVGKNGAGKSTIAKLIARLYDPCEGVVTINGVSYPELNVNDLRSQLAYMFQDYQKYAYSVAENVLARPCVGRKDELLVEMALEKVGLLDAVNRRKHGIYAQVTKEFDKEGIQFSGGSSSAFLLRAPLLKMLRLSFLTSHQALWIRLASRK